MITNHDAVKQWKMDHPDRNREINREAQRRWYAKNRKLHYSRTRRYIVSHREWYSEWQRQRRIMKMLNEI